MTRDPIDALIGATDLIEALQRKVKVLESQVKQKNHQIALLQYHVKNGHHKDGFHYATDSHFAEIDQEKIHDLNFINLQIENIELKEKLSCLEKR